MKRTILSLLFALILCFPVIAQNYNREKNSWVNYIVRMYNNAPFEGVKIVDDTESQNLIVVLSWEPKKYGGNEATMSRIAAVKAQSQATRFFSGSNISTDVFIKTVETSDSTRVETIETIKEQSAGLVKSLELLIAFIPESDASHKVYIFSTPVKKQ